MAEALADARRKVHDALVQRGFARSWVSSERFVYSGKLDDGGLHIPVEFEITDFDFVHYPEIRLDPAWPSPARKVPHVLGRNYAVCYFAKGAVILDRYNPGGTVLLCLTQAEKVLRDAIRGRSDADFADEFQSYWSTQFAYVDLPGEYAGPATVKYIKLTDSSEPLPIIAARSSWLIDRDTRKNVDRDDGERAEVIRINRALSLDPSMSWPPTTLDGLNKWLTVAAPEALGRIEKLFATGSGWLRTVVLSAANGSFYYRAALPTQFRTPEFLNNRRAALPKILTQSAKNIAIEQSVGVLADKAHIFHRNLGDRFDVSDIRIAVIGCGTIGGFLAQYLAQCGCGSGKGHLILYDGDRLSPGNLGRHLLGVPYLDRNKAVGVAEFLKTQLPPLDVTARDSAFPWDHLTSQDYDLVIDATGEEAFSVALNAYAVDRRPDAPPVLFVWLAGDGAAARAILTGAPDRACLKCLKPELGGEERFATLRPGVKATTMNARGCGDSAFIPFPVTRPVSAAAMACDMVLDWTKGGVFDHFRALIFDKNAARITKNSSPEPLAHCPACGARRL